MTLRLLYSASKGEFEKAMRELYKPIAEAASAAITEASADIKTQGRASIGRAGFSKRWQNAFRVNVYPGRGKVSADAAALAFHKIPYAEVFESGATIRGKPRLWLPLTAPGKKVQKARGSPERFRKEIGPLTYVDRRGKPPLLVAPAMLGKAQANKAHPHASVRALKRGAAGFQGARGPRTVLRTVPIFVGVPRVDISKKFAVRKVIERAANRLAELYVKHLKTE
jgi:hypothetical protein